MSAGSPMPVKGFAEDYRRTSTSATIRVRWTMQDLANAAVFAIHLPGQRDCRPNGDWRRQRDGARSAVDGASADGALSRAKNP